MWSVSSRYEALSREQKIIDILQDNGQRNCCLGLHEQKSTITRCQIKPDLHLTYKSRGMSSANAC